MNKTRKKIRWNSVLIILFFSYDLFYAMITKVIRDADFCSMILDVIIFVVMLITIMNNKKRIKIDAVLLVIMSFIIFGVTYMIHPQYKEVMLRSSSWNIFKMIFNLHGGLFAYFIIRTEDSFDDLIKDLKIAIIPVWICYTLKTVGGVSFNSVSAISGNVITRNYNQVYGFKFLFVALMLTYMGFYEKKKVCLFLSIIVLIQIVMYASRTALLAYITFIVIYFLFNQRGKNKNVKRIMYILLFGICAYIIESNYFLKAVTDILNKFGLSSKIIDSFINSSNSIDGGRLFLWTDSLTLIKSHFWGVGVYYDRYLYNVYVHSIFLEILANFGWLIGMIIIVYLIKIIITMLTKADQQIKIIFMVFSSLSIVRLLLSYSFWYDINFWIMIAIYYNYREYIKLKNREGDRIETK